MFGAFYVQYICVCGIISASIYDQKLSMKLILANGLRYWSYALFLAFIDLSNRIWSYGFGVHWEMLNNPTPGFWDIVGATISNYWMEPCLPHVIMMLLIAYVMMRHVSRSIHVHKIITSIAYGLGIVMGFVPLECAFGVFFGGVLMGYGYWTGEFLKELPKLYFSGITAMSAMRRMIPFVIALAGGSFITLYYGLLSAKIMQYILRD